MKKQDGKLVSINSPQGSRVVGRLVNNVLHIDRDYETHHLHKYRGWAMAVEVFTQHPQIRGIRINAKNAPMSGGGKGQRIYLFSFDEAGLEPSDMEIKDFGHGQQTFIPDSLWEVLDTNGFLRTDKATKKPEEQQALLPKEPAGDKNISPPFPPPEYDEPKEQPMFTVDTTHPYVVKKPYRTFDTDIAIKLLDAGYTLHLFQIQEGLRLKKDGDNYILNVPGIDMDIPINLESMVEKMQGKLHTLDF